MTSMKTVGELFRESRNAKRLSLEDIADRTNIKLEFLQAIEDDAFSRLPKGPFMRGFVKTYALELGLDADHILAVYRRDFGKQPTQELVPKGVLHPLRRTRFSVTPEILTACVVCLVLAVFFVYQWGSLRRPPSLDVRSPKDRVELRSPVVVSGTTNTDAVVYINDVPVAVDQDGWFRKELQLSPGDATITVRAEDRKGKMVTVARSVRVVE